LVSEASLRVTLGLNTGTLQTQAQRKAWVNFAVDTFLASMQAGASR
jgi:hypothetical protein